MYTYTKRRDLHDVYECFVGGSTKVNPDISEQNINRSSERNIRIIESGFNCKRGLNVNTFGMPLTKQSKYEQ